MSGKGGTSNGKFSYRRRTIPLLPNGENSDQVVRTYKRRNSSNHKFVSFFEKGSLKGSTSKSSEPRKKEGENYVCNNGSINGSLSDSNHQCRTFVLQHMYQSLKSDDDGIRRHIRDAQIVTESDGDSESRHSPLQTIPSSVDDAFTGNCSYVLNCELNNQSISVSETCGRAFFNVIQSEKFTQLCRLLFENFQGIKTEKLLDLSIIDRRMKEGAYDRSPLLFSSDIQQLWVELQKIGNELVTLSTGLLDYSRICLNEQMGRVVNSSPNDTNFEFGTRKSESLSITDPAESCKKCGAKADVKDSLLCDWCEEFYYFSCAEFHDNCIVCARLTASKRIRGSTLLANEVSLNHRGGSSDKPNGSVCKFCETEVGRNDSVKICEHVSCPFKYFHARCLSATQLKSHGPSWYCPSCLCRVCLADKDDDKIVLCDSCDNAFHLYCLTPPLVSIPRGKWTCSHCDVDLQILLNVRNAYQVLESKRKVDHALDKKTRGGMDTLLSAALKSEHNKNTL